MYLCGSETTRKEVTVEIRNVSREELEQALDRTNLKFGGNVRWNRLDKAGKTLLGGSKFKVTLKVNDSRKLGAKLGYQGRRTVSACWHVHGTFFDSLPSGVEIVTMGKKKYAGDAWEDYDLGSQAYPMRFSEACEC